ncbi:MAG: tannase/feruloyl esterase family alpha/beta hydrolase [Pirellulaceae bacterium]|nr:tannase/feruloyl esterase family alpha/beta hydrolase [Pirellulaceae bacterium]
MKLFLAVVFVATASVQAAGADVRWNSRFTERYQSRAEGVRVPFAVRTPPKVDGMEKYPLLIALSGGLRAAPSEQFPFFQANPTRTRIWGYRSISTYDAMRVVAAMKEKYPIDADRVYLMGSSAGGSGAMHLASCYPDQFAAVLPLVAAGNNYPLANFRNLPVAFHHGDRDWTSAICNARVQASRLEALGCPVILKEYAAGHSVPGSHAPLMEWLFAQKRNPTPRTITHDCEAPSLGRSYWITIKEFDDPHQRAFVEAAITDRTVTVRPKNVAAFSLAAGALPNVATVEIDGKRLAIAANYSIQDGRWSIVDNSPAPATRPYESGGAANLFQGEPLLIVYGTAGARTEQLRAAAGKLAKYGGPDYTTMPGAFPVVADVDLTSKQASKSNLMLVGTPQENIISQGIVSELPIEIEDGALLAGGRSKLPLQNQVLSLLHTNPKHPQRLVYLLAPFTDETTFARFTAAPQQFLAGPDGFDRVSQPDLLIQNTEHKIARQMQFDKQWNWLEFPDSDKPIPHRYSERAHLAVTYMEIMKTKSQADFALWWGPADKGMWGADFNDLENYNPEFYTAADYRTQHRHYETTIGTVSGVDLKTIWNRWGTNYELQSVPEIVAESLDDKREYRIHIPMDLYIKLGQRRKNLGNPQAGPKIPAEEVLVEIFK